MTNSTAAVPEKTTIAKSWHIGEEVILELFLFVTALVFLVVSFQYPVQARFVPTVVLVPLIIGLGIQIWLAMRRPVPKEEVEGRRATLKSAFWMLVLIVLLYLGGLAWGLGLFVMLYMRTYCRESWRVTLITTGVLGAGMFFFLTYLKLPMYWGVILELLGL